jgi:excisionase family DNA binding protein
VKVSVTIEPGERPESVAKKLEAVVNAAISMDVPVLVEKTVGLETHYRPSEAAKKLGIAASTLRDLITDRLIGYVGITEGKAPRYLIPESALKAYLDKRTVNPLRGAADDYRVGVRRPSRKRRITR